jgi:hypothetical protein
MPRIIPDWLVNRIGLLAADLWGLSGCRWQWAVNLAMTCRFCLELRDDAGPA